MLKLEVGKIYTTEEGALYKIVTDKYKGYSPLSDSNPFLGVCLTGPGCIAFPGNGHSGGSFRLVKEYKEPVVHKKVVFWVKAEDGSIRTYTRHEAEAEAFRKNPFRMVVHETHVEYAEQK